MNSYVTGTTIKTLREKQNMTQNELAKALGISVCELLSGEYIINGNVSANIVKSKPGTGS